MYMRDKVTAVLEQRAVLRARDKGVEECGLGGAMHPLVVYIRVTSHRGSGSQKVIMACIASNQTQAACQCSVRLLNMVMKDKIMAGAWNAG